MKKSLLTIVSILLVAAFVLAACGTPPAPAAAQAVKINTAVLRRRSSSMGAIVQALSIALHQVAERKEVR